MKAQTITIIGLERTGASIGLALKQSTLEGITIVGHDLDKARAETAKEIVGAVDKAEWNLVRAAQKADILVITSPVSEVENILQVIGSEMQPHALILDLSGLKRPGLDWAKQNVKSGHYIGAVPVLAAGSLADGRTAVEAASADLFRQSAFCLMPSPKADPKAVETAVNFGLLLGAVPYFVDPDEYDTLVQATETLPGLLAAALFGAVQKATGWRDMLRFAGLQFALATSPLTSSLDITLMALHNKEASLRWLDALLAELQEIRRLVVDADPEIVDAAFTDLSIERDKWLAARTKNAWDERAKTDVKPRSMTEHLFGGWIAGRGEEDDE